MTALIVGSLWTSAVIRSYAWMILFQRYGIVNEALIALGFADAPVRILQTTTAVVIGMVHVLLPFMLLPLIATMRRIDRNLLRAGTYPWRRSVPAVPAGVFPAVAAWRACRHRAGVHHSRSASSSRRRCWAAGAR